MIAAQCAPPGALGVEESRDSTEQNAGASQVGATSRKVQQRKSADGLGNQSQVRVQRCGKSAPAFQATGTAW